MELIEIIKQTVFLIVLIGFGVFSLSYSIYKIRTRNKIEPVILPHQIEKRKPVNSIELQKHVESIYQNSMNRTTSERFIVLNDVSSNKSVKEHSLKKSTNNYQLKSIRNTGMYTLKFE